MDPAVAAVKSSREEGCDGERRRDTETAGGVPPAGGGASATERSSAVKNGAEMLQARRDLFDSDEEMEEFGESLRQMREEERVRYRD
jgi:hypothetical protein